MSTRNDAQGVMPALLYERIMTSGTLTTAHAMSCCSRQFHSIYRQSLGHHIDCARRYVTAAYYVRLISMYIVEMVRRNDHQYVEQCMKFAVDTSERWRTTFRDEQSTVFVLLFVHHCHQRYRRTAHLYMQGRRAFFIAARSENYLNMHRSVIYVLLSVVPFGTKHIDALGKTLQYIGAFRLLNLHTYQSQAPDMVRWYYSNYSVDDIDALTQTFVFDLTVSIANNAGIWIVDGLDAHRRLVARCRPSCVHDVD